MILSSGGIEFGSRFEGHLHTLGKSAAAKVGLKWEASPTVIIPFVRLSRRCFSITESIS